MNHQIAPLLWPTPKTYVHQMVSQKEHGSQWSSLNGPKKPSRVGSDVFHTGTSDIKFFLYMPA